MERQYMFWRTGGGFLVGIVLFMLWLTGMLTALVLTQSSFVAALIFLPLGLAFVWLSRRAPPFRSPVSNRSEHIDGRLPNEKNGCIRQ